MPHNKIPACFEAFFGVTRHNSPKFAITAPALEGTSVLKGAPWPPWTEHKSDMPTYRPGPITRGACCLMLAGFDERGIRKRLPPLRCACPIATHERDGHEGWQCGQNTWFCGTKHAAVLTSPEPSAAELSPPPWHPWHPQRHMSHNRNKNSASTHS
jgi:hypothetical protein